MMTPRSSSRFAWLVCLSLLILPWHLQAQGMTNFILGENAETGLTLQVDPLGVIRTLGDVTMAADYRVENTNTVQNRAGVVVAESGFPKREGTQSWTLQGQYKPISGGQPLHFEEAIARTSASALKFSIGVSRPDKSEPVYKLRWSILLPVEVYANRVIVTDKQNYTLPKDLKEYPIGGGPVKFIEIPTDTGTLRITGALKVLVADARAFKGNNYQLIIEPEAAPADPFVRKIAVDLSFQPHRFDTVSLAPSANMGFADEVAGDGRGGWTDQGKDHDLSALEPGRRLFGNVLFDVTDPKQNNGRSCLVFAGPQLIAGIKEATFDLKSAPYRTFFIMHAFAWDQKDKAELGRLIFTFTDGTTTEFPVRAAEEATNWTVGSDTPNGPIVWKGKTPSGDRIGLNMSRFILPGKPLKNVQIKGSGSAVWLVVGATGSLDAVPMAANLVTKPLVYEEDKVWKIFSFEKDVEPGSILDFSGNLDAPAGKYGFLQSRNGRLYFEKKPEKRVRLLGTNLVFAANFVDKALADRLAKRLAAQGYNTVRIHHYDGLLLNKNPKNSYDINLEQLDKLDYLIAACKKEGLYISIDLYTTRPFPAGELAEIKEQITQGVKAAIAISPSAMKSWQEFATLFLKHKNPYTGLTLGEDPALVGINPLNENVHSVFWNNDPNVAAYFQEKFTEHLKKIGKENVNADERSLLFARFLSDLQIKTQAEIRDFLRKNIGTKSILTDVSHREYKPLTIAREPLDYVDVHRYWDHPKFVGAQWRLPYLYECESALTQLVKTPREVFPARLPNHPFMMTEFQFVYPNPYRAEAGPIMGAYAAFQDWDGLMRFDYAGDAASITDTAPIRGFSTVNDPLHILGERLVSLLFVREDVKPTQNLVLYHIDPEKTFANADGIGSFSQDYSKIGLVTGLGSTSLTKPVATGKTILATVEPKGSTEDNKTVFAESADLLDRLVKAGRIPASCVEGKILHSDTGEITLDTEKASLSVVTPNTEAYVLRQTGSLSGAVATVQANGQVVISISAMDGQPLAKSQRMLILHLTDIKNTGTTFRNQDGRILEAWGKAPLLIRSQSDTLSLKLKAPAGKSYTLWAVGINGKRLWKVPVQSSGEGLTCKLETVSKDGPAMAYELIADTTTP